jgi:hypothetical protein
MKKFKVIASYVTYCEAEIDAVNEVQAYEIAQQMDGADFYHKGIDDWDISTVEEIEQ